MWFKKSNPDLRTRFFKPKRLGLDQEDMNRLGGLPGCRASPDLMTLEGLSELTVNSSRRLLQPIELGLSLQETRHLKTPGHDDNSSYIIFSQKVSLLSSL